MTQLSFPLDVAELEKLPRNARRAQTVGLAKSLLAANRSADLDLLIQDLCQPRPAASAAAAATGARSPATPSSTASPPPPPQGKDTEALKRVLLPRTSTTDDDEDVEPADPTTTYHLQELGLLVCVAVNRPAHLLRLAKQASSAGGGDIAQRALALAVHASSITDQDLRDVFAALSERDKLKLVRTCANNSDGGHREALTTEFVHQWLVDGTEERKLVACELLGYVSPNSASSDWLPGVLRDVVRLGRIAEAEGRTKTSSSSGEYARYQALRRDVLWKRHAAVLVGMIEHDLEQERGSVVGHARVFEFYRSLLDCTQWRVPGQKQQLSGQTLGNLGQFVPVKRLLGLYFAHLPFQPQVSAQTWLFCHTPGAVNAQAASISADEQARLASALELRQDDLPWHDRSSSSQTNAKSAAEWARLAAVVRPDWLFHKQLVLARVTPGQLLDAYDGLVTKEGGVIPQCLLQLAGQVLEHAFELAAGARAPTSTGGVHPETFARMVAIIKQVLGCITKRSLYIGQRDRDSCATDDEYQLDEDRDMTQRLVVTVACKELLTSARISVGQQLDLFAQLQSFLRQRMRLKAGVDFPASDDGLLMVSPQRIVQMIKTYEDFLAPFSRAVLDSVSNRMRALQAADKPANDQLNQLFNRLVHLALLDIETDVETLYGELAPRFPVVFGNKPQDRLPARILPQLMSYSSLSQTQVVEDFDLQSDEPARMCSQLLEDVVLPRMRSDTSELFANVSSAHQFATADAGSVRTRALAMESMEQVRHVWFADRVLCIKPWLLAGAVSPRVLTQLLDYLDEWIDVAQGAVSRARAAKQASYAAAASSSSSRVVDPQKRDDHPTSAPNAMRSLETIAGFLDELLTKRCDAYKQNEWKQRQGGGGGDKDAVVVGALLERVVRSWSRAYAWSRVYGNPLAVAAAAGSTSPALEPYEHAPLLRQVIKIPFALRQPFLPWIRRFFLLRVQGKGELPGGHWIDSGNAPKPKLAGSSSSKRPNSDDDKPWFECSTFFKQIFPAASDGAHDVLMHLERHCKTPLAGFLKTLDAYLDIRDAQVRKRFEQDLARSVFADRQQAMYTLLDASIRCTTSASSLGEVSKSLARIAQCIENEQHDNRVDVLNNVLHKFTWSVTRRVLPAAISAATSGVSDAKDRALQQFLLSAPKEEDWPALVDAAARLPTLLLKLLDDLLESTDEKSESDFKLFKSLSDDLFRRALTWPCTTTVLFGQEQQRERVLGVQRAWFELAVELQFRIACYRSGRALAASTFRALVGTSTLNQVKQFVFEAGAQCDVAYPVGDGKEVADFHRQASTRRKLAAQHVCALFDQAYKSRLGGGSSTRGQQDQQQQPLMRKPAVEKKRLLDMLAMVQGEWVHCASLAGRITGCVDLATANKSHQNQLVDIMLAATEASAMWGVRCRDYRPAWARNANATPHASLTVRPQKAGKTTAPLVRMRMAKATAAMAKAKAKTKTTSSAGEAEEEEDAVWCTAKYFEFLPPVVPRYWRQCVEAFGVHHPKGAALGRALLRMHIRYTLWQAASSSSSPVRASKQHARVGLALQLLDVCPSAVHLRLCQAVLRDFRQDLLVSRVFDAFAPDSPALGKFSVLCPEEDDEGEGGRDDGDDGDASSVAVDPAAMAPFRLHGFYGFHQLTYEQGRRLAALWIGDAQSSQHGTLLRVRAINHLTFLPCVGHEDFAGILRQHYEDKLAYQHAIKQRKAGNKSVEVEEEEDAAIPMPLPESVVETTFQAILSDASPLSLLSLLDSKMVQKSSSRTTVRVAERMRVLLKPDAVLGVIRILLSRRGRDGLQVGPVKALVRILFALAQEKPVVVGQYVVDGAQRLITAQWNRKDDLHPDARVVLLLNALKAAGAASASSLAAAEFAWDILDQVSRQPELPNKFRAFLASADPVAPKSPLGEDNSSHTASSLAQSTKEFDEMVKEVNMAGRATVADGLEDRFLALLLRARDTCLVGFELVVVADQDKDKEEEEEQAAEGKAGQAKLGTAAAAKAKAKLARHAAMVRALLTLDLARWIPPLRLAAAAAAASEAEEHTFAVFAALEQAIRGSCNSCSSSTESAAAAAPNYDDQALEQIYSVELPQQLAKLANALHNPRSLETVTTPERVVERLRDGLVRTFLFALLKDEPLTRHYARQRCANRLRNIVTHLSDAPRTGKPADRLYNAAFAIPFQKEILLLKQESQVAATLAEFLPDPVVS